VRYFGGTNHEADAIKRDVTNGGGEDVLYRSVTQNLKRRQQRISLGKDN